ncbi:hypothetical protein ABK040_004669 [Willaertia magna]
MSHHRRRFFNTLQPSNESSSTSSPSIPILSNISNKSNNCIKQQALPLSFSTVSSSFQIFSVNNNQMNEEEDEEMTEIINKTNHPILLVNSPTCFNILEKSNFIKVEKDLQTIKYNGRQEVGSIRSNVPFSGNSLIDYFEIQILDTGDKSSIMIGLTNSKSDFINTKYPGFEIDSFGYYGSDGKCYNNCKGLSIKNYSDNEEDDFKFMKDDIIGCGINYFRKTIFFTKNGIFIGDVFQLETIEKLKNISFGKLFPTIGLHSRGECIKIIFKDFLFDLNKLIKNEKHLIEKEINNSLIEDKDDLEMMNDLDLIIREYLYIHGYSNTLKAFEKCSGLKPIYNFNEIEKRKEICNLIENGNSLKALELIENNNLINDNNILIKIHCQIFIEMIKENKRMDALNYARKYLSNFILNNNESLKKYLIDTIGLLSYNNLNDCPLNYLLNIENRRELSNEVNQMILLIENDKKNISSLEYIVKQIELTNEELQRVGGGKLVDTLFL